MSDELVFYTNPWSRGRIVRWMLEEVGAPYETIMLEYGTTMKARQYLAINPMGKVPAIVHNGAVVTECAAICAYLADAFPKAQLAPPTGDTRRAGYYRWLFFTAGPLEAAVLNKGLGVVIPQERKGMAGYGSIEEVTATLEAAVAQNEFICGDQFTAADVYVGSHIAWTMQFGMLDKRPAFNAYWARIKDRPAAIKARALDDALIPKDKGATQPQ